MYKELSIDVETRSSVDIKKCGMYKYFECPNFEIILFAWAFDDEPVQVVDDMNEIPDAVIKALTNPAIIKTAFNAAFEIGAISTHFRIKLDSLQWRCTMVMCAAVGLPQSLDAAGRALNLDTTKDAQGKALIKLFCVPCKPTKTNGMRTWNNPKDFPDKWLLFAIYCKTDVHQERLIKKYLSFFKMPSDEVLIWALDRRINDRGIMLDPDLIEAALEVAEWHKEYCFERAQKLTGLNNPGSNKQMKGWMEAAIGESIDSLNKKAMPAVLKQVSGSVAEEVLELRNELSKTSVKKYDTMKRMICDDNFVRGLLQYYGAGRTGRWAGRGLQPHNLPRNTMKLLDEARQLVKNKDLDAIQMLWKSPPDVLSQLIRTAFVPRQGYSLVPSDYAAIEARVTAWLSNETWRLDVFNTHGKIYEASASTMFKVALDSISYKDSKGETQKGPNYHLRQNGKTAELSLGFGGGPQALINMGALDMDFMIKFVENCKIKWDSNKVENKDDFKDYEDYKQKRIMGELAKLVRMWRNANKNVVSFWDDVNEAAINAIQNPGVSFKVARGGCPGVEYYVKYNILWCKLPSGRCLAYQSPMLRPGKFGGHEITYLGVNQYSNRWERLSTYGGKLVENMVQAIARDLLATAMLNLDRAGFCIVMHVHDEVILEVPTAFAASSVIRINKIMAERPAWARTLPLGAESFVTQYYKKE